MYLPKSHEEIVTLLMWHKHRVRDLLSNEREMWRKYKKLYEAQTDDDYPLTFNTFMPWVTSIVDTHIPRYVHGLLFRDPVVQLMSLHPETPPESVSNMSLLLNGGAGEGWLTNSKAYMSNVMMLKEALLYGTSWAKIEFVQKKATFIKKIPVPDVPNTYIEKEVTYYPVNRSEIIHMDCFDCYPDLDSFHNADRQFFIHSFIQEMAEIEFGPVEYDDVSAVKEMSKYVMDEDWKTKRLQESGRDYLDREVADLYQDPRLIDECYVREHTKDGEKIWLISICNEEKIIRKVLLSHWPIITCRHCPNPHEALGSSVIKKLEKLQLSINDAANLQQEANLHELAPSFLVGAGANADLDQFVMEPLNIIQVDDITQVQELRYKGSNSMQNTMSMLVNALQTASNIQDYLQGQTPQRQEYASTVVALQQASEATIDEGIKWKSKEWLVEEANIMMIQAQEHLDSPTYVPDRQGNLHPIDSMSLQGVLGCKCASAATGMNEMQRNTLMDFAGILGKLLGDMLPYEARVRIVEELSKTYDGLEGLKDVLAAIAQQPPAPVGQPGQPGAASGQGQPVQSPVQV